MNGISLSRFKRVATVVVVGAIALATSWSCGGTDAGPPLVDELVKDRNVYYGKDLDQAQRYIDDFTIALPEYLPPGYTLDHVRITSGMSSDALHLQAGFTKGPDGADGVFNYLQGPYPDVGGIWSLEEPRELGGLPFSAKYKYGSLGLWTHWEENGVAYTMLVIGEHENDLVEVRKVIKSIP